MTGLAGKANQNLKSLTGIDLGLGDDGDIDIPTVEAGNLKKTAQPIKQLSEADIKRRRKQASLLTRGFAPPRLSEASLLGIPGPGV